ncbi:MAG: hypothetical protein RL885_21600 [Planctomycetota bacterium]
MSLAAACLVLSLVAPSLAAQEKSRLVVVDSPELLVVWEVASIASLADDDWLAIIIENRTKRDLRIVRTEYDVSRSEVDPELPFDSLVFARLSAGNSKRLFHAFETDGDGRHLLPPGSHRLSDSLTDDATAAVGEAPLGGSTLELRCDLHLEVEGLVLPKRKWVVEMLRVEWLELNRERALRARARLQHILEHPERRTSQSRLLDTLLRTELVSRALTVEQLLAALDLRTHATEGRAPLLGHLGRELGRDPKVTRYLTDWLNRGDTAAAMALGGMPGAWDPSFIEPLTKIFEADLYAQPHVLRAFEHGGNPQAKDPELAQRLSRAVLAFRPLPAADDDPSDPQALAQLILALGQTHDVHLIPMLKEHLGDERRVLELRLLSAKMPWPPPPLRIRDAALDAILMILDGDHLAAYGEERDAMLPLDNVDKERALCDLRDTMIEKLEKRLE